MSKMSKKCRKMTKKCKKKSNDDKKYQKIQKKSQNVKEDASLYATRYLFFAYYTFSLKIHADQTNQAEGQCGQRLLSLHPKIRNLRLKAQRRNSKVEIPAKSKTRS